MTRACSPRSLAEALRLLAADPELRPVAGCTDLMVSDAGARAALPAVMDLSGIPEIRGLRARAGGLEIGAATTFTEIRRAPEVAASYPALAAAAAEIGGWQIQNRATIGGNLVNASPAGDSLPVLLVLDASVVAAGAQGERTIPYRSFHVGYRQTALARGELLTRILLPPPPVGSRQLFRKVGTREAQAISKVVVALLVQTMDGHLADLRLAAGSVAPTPVRLETVEQGLRGLALDARTADLAAELCAAAVQPIDDVRSTAEYRRITLGRVVRRMLLDLRP